MIGIIFTPWRAFVAYRDRAVTSAYLRRIVGSAETEFRHGVASPKTGRVYRKRGRVHRASAPGQYPAKDTGELVDSLSNVVRQDEVSIGTSKFYSKFLREGTRKMARRLMSDTALNRAIDKDTVGIGRFMRFRSG